MRGRRKISVVIHICFLFGLIILSQVYDVSAIGGQDHRMALVIVSTYGLSQDEFAKANSFHQYLLDDGYQNDDIIHFGSESGNLSEGISNVSNVESGFDRLRSDSDPDKEIVIYISDHVPPLSGDRVFRFVDGNISMSLIDSWIDDITCVFSTVIVGGNYSGVVGPELSDPVRDVICSMGANQSFSPDLFNITRSLEDPSADTNHDGQVSYIEAYWKEVDNLQGTDQDPCIWI